MACDTEQVEAIEACRTCGIYYMSTTNYLKPIFQSPVDYPDMMLIRLELAQWKLEISENDGLPQHVCSSCIHEFQKIFKFRSYCADTQEQLRVFYNLREQNLANLKIKTEILEPEDVSQCDFIYVDDISDEECDSVTPFKIPHVPIKEEKIEEATVPREDDESKVVCVAESASERATNNGVVTPRSVLAQSPMLEQQNEGVTSASSPMANSLVLESHSKAEASVECELCQHLSPNEEEHKQHMRRVHQNRDMECHICGKVFKNSTQARFKFHLKWHNINKHVKCSQCGFVCSSRQGLKEHKRAVHAKINCRICGVGVLAKKMKSHLRGHEILTQYRCEYCAEGFSSIQDREYHIWQIHANDSADEDPYQSSPFEEKTSSKNLSNSTECAEIYEDVVNVELMCAHCDQKFAHQGDLEVHANQEHFKSTQQLILSQDLSHSDSIITSQPCTGSAVHPVHQGVTSTAVPVKDYDVECVDDQEEGSCAESEDGNTITVFEDYGNDDDSAGLPQQVSNPNQQNFSQFHSNILLADDTDAEGEATIEHFAEEQHETNTQSQSMHIAEDIDSSAESENEVEETPSCISNNIPQFSCAKCTNTFTTIDQLRLHYQQHQQSEQIEKSNSTKSKFKCHICDKQFDLKFSLNRHIRKHIP